jgi:hypothetical protein
MAGSHTKGCQLSRNISVFFLASSSNTVYVLSSLCPVDHFLPSCCALGAQARAAEADDQRGVAGLLAKAAAAKAEDAFKSAAAAEVFGSLAGGGMSLDARISSRRHYHER